MGDQAIPAGGLLDIPDSIETPSLVVDRARMERNIADMAAYAAGRGIGLAPHAKTHRTPEIARLQMAAGAEMLCIAKLGEAEVLADAGLDSFVMAYPIVGDAKIARARRLMRRASILLSVDSFAGAEALGAGMAAEGAVADVLVITDTGYHRCGVAAAEAVDFAAAVAPLPGVRLRGLITHEGHAYSKPGEEGLHNASVDAGQAMVDAAADLRARGLEIDVVSVGSSATARHTTAVDGITQVRPGIYAFNDYGQVLRGVVGLDRCAARVAATVVSHAEADRAILDAGSKSVSHDRLGIHVPGAPGGYGLVVDLPGWELYQLSEEHGWLRWTGDGPPSELTIGQRVQILPNHICSVFHMLGQSEIVEGGQHIATWVATGRGQSR
ncbi:MAG: alanine racemase [bacterium]|nr:alanine racemase [bacterium]MXZ31319.1 alanine racemase [Acidimicrobiia bacterium]MYB24570.1 alanine racemase [Acidimicrobiia bacterium]MYJ14807.1 alanine racemase [Acidimicrobiia bacterium]